LQSNLDVHWNVGFPFVAISALPPAATKAAKKIAESTATTTTAVRLQPIFTIHIILLPLLRFTQHLVCCAAAGQQRRVNAKMNENSPFPISANFSFAYAITHPCYLLDTAQALHWRETYGQ
jgi:hypothetical protein